MGSICGNPLKIQVEDCQRDYNKEKFITVHYFQFPIEIFKIGDVTGLPHQLLLFHNENNTTFLNELASNDKYQACINFYQLSDAQLEKLKKEKDSFMSQAFTLDIKYPQLHDAINKFLSDKNRQIYHPTNNNCYQYCDFIMKELKASGYNKDCLKEYNKVKQTDRIATMTICQALNIDKKFVLSFMFNEKEQKTYVCNQSQEKQQEEKSSVRQVHEEKNGDQTTQQANIQNQEPNSSQQQQQTDSQNNNNEVK